MHYMMGRGKQEEGGPKRGVWGKEGVQGIPSTGSGWLLFLSQIRRHETCRLFFPFHDGIEV